MIRDTRPTLNDDEERMSRVNMQPGDMLVVNPKGFQALRIAELMGVNPIHLDHVLFIKARDRRQPTGANGEVISRTS